MSGNEERSRSRSREREQEWRADVTEDGGNAGNAGAAIAENSTEAIPPPDNQGNNLYITNLSFKTTNESLQAAFSAFGEVVSASVVKEPNTQTSRGFGFVEFADATCSERAIAEMNGGVLDGREIKVERAKRNRGYEKTPGRYLGPAQVSAKFSTGGRGGGGYRDSSYRGGQDRGYGGSTYDRDYDRSGGYDRGGAGGYRERPAYRDDRFSSRGNEYAVPYSGGGYREDVRAGYSDYRGGGRDYDRRDAYTAAGYPAVDYSSRGRDYDYRAAPRDYVARDPRDVRADTRRSYDDRGGYSAAPGAGGYDSRAGGRY